MKKLALLFLLASLLTSCNGGDKIRTKVTKELNDCYFKTELEGKFLNDDLTIYFNNDCVPDHQRGLYINEEYREYDIFNEDLDPSIFEELDDYFSREEEEYLMVFLMPDGTRYGILIDTEEEQFTEDSEYWKLYRFNFKDGYSYGDYGIFWRFDNDIELGELVTAYHEHNMELVEVQTSDVVRELRERREQIEAEKEAEEEAAYADLPKLEVIWEGDLLRRIKYCTEPPSVFSLGCEWYYEEKDGTVIDLQLPLFSQSFASRSPDETYFMIVNNVDNSISRFDWINDTRETIFSTYDTAYDTVQGSSGFEWSPSGQKIGIVILNFDAEDYPEGTKLFVMEFDENGNYLGKEKYNIKVTHSCHSAGCDPIANSFSFIDEDTIEYTTFEGYDPYDEDKNGITLTLEL